MEKAVENKNKFTITPIKMHPRVFSALGADLVTNDTVAIIELVKNSYDAFAHNVWIRFKRDTEKGIYLEIEDDGSGMSETIITDVWSVVATPHKEENPFSKDGNKKRRVAGEKGLGRLSMARLGNKLEMLTQNDGQPCWEVHMDWSEISAGNNIETSTVSYRKYAQLSPFVKSGTMIKIYELKDEWDDENLDDLQENLSRLISPFAKVGEFNIYLLRPSSDETEPIKIESPEFLSKPKYSIVGRVDKNGNISCIYRFNPNLVSLDDKKIQKRDLTNSWENIYDFIVKDEKLRKKFFNKKAHCGSFDFEIRAWDIGKEDAENITERFNFKSSVRKAIGAHKGISVYRDSILILPKSDSARDWLGLDLRRVSDVGKRLSTSQLVGYVSITAENNPKIEDTSDRERLSSTLEVDEFKEILKAVIRLMENERYNDRQTIERPKPLEDLFNQLKAEKLLEDVTELAESGADKAEMVSAVRAYNQTAELACKTIQERFVYYSRMATIGTIAQILVHEIRNRTTAIGAFFDRIKNKFSLFQDKRLEEDFNGAVESAYSLERLSDTFAPLASRNFRRRSRHSILEKRIQACFDLQQGEIKRKKIECRYPATETVVAVDPGELDAILLNLINNSIYWLGEVQERDRIIEFNIERNENDGRVKVWANDNGSGIKEDDLEKIFWPGVTRKPGGIGMGLTVASELVAEYGGCMATKYPGVRGGATFLFDLPVVKA